MNNVSCSYLCIKNNYVTYEQQFNNSVAQEHFKNINIQYKITAEVSSVLLICVSTDYEEITHNQSPQCWAAPLAEPAAKKPRKVSPVVLVIQHIIEDSFSPYQTY